VVRVFKQLTIVMPAGEPLIYDAQVFFSDSVRWTVVGGLFVFGAVLGSFINVVAYRLPRGMSLIRPGSQCPACERPIRWFDNVPILGWLWLGGRCRDCQAPISIRYPVVEALVGVASALVGWAVAVVEVAPPPDLQRAFVVEVAPYAYHMLLVCTLIVAALIEFDGHRPTLRMLVSVLVVGWVAASIWPGVRADAVAGTAWQGMVDGARGLLAALVLGALGWPAWVATAQRSDVMAGATAVATLALVGVFLGAAALAVVAVAAMFGYAVLRACEGAALSLRRLGWAAVLAVATLVEIAGSAWDVAPTTYFTGREGWMAYVLAGTMMAVLALVARFARPGVPQPRDA
jgi:leader peptidase (prepilin peptidase)/N-methyltransferase